MAICPSCHQPELLASDQILHQYASTHWTTDVSTTQKMLHITCVFISGFVHLPICSLTNLAYLLEHINTPFSPVAASILIHLLCCQMTSINKLTTKWNHHHLHFNIRFPCEPGLAGTPVFCPQWFRKKTFGDKCHRFLWAGCPSPNQQCKETSISCRGWTHVMHCIMANVLQTKVTAQTDILATELSWQRLRQVTFSSYSELFIKSCQF